MKVFFLVRIFQQFFSNLQQIFQRRYQEIFINKSCHLDKLSCHTIFIQVIRLKTTNPGKWFIHCHIEVHAIEGMGMVLNEAPELEVSPPPGFPVCNNFYNDRSRDMQYINEQQCK